MIYPNVRHCYDHVGSEGASCYLPPLQYRIRRYPIEYSWALFASILLVLFLLFRLSSYLISVKLKTPGLQTKD
jgi:hypothetical protein